MLTLDQKTNMCIVFEKDGVELVRIMPLRPERVRRLAFKLPTDVNVRREPLGQEDVVPAMAGACEITAFTAKCRNPGVNPQKFGKISWREILFDACDIIDSQDKQLKALEKNLHEECASSVKTINVLQEKVKAKDEVEVHLRKSWHEAEEMLVIVRADCAKYEYLNETVALTCTPPDDCNDPVVLKRYMKACFDAVVEDEDIAK